MKQKKRYLHVLNNVLTDLILFVTCSKNKEKHEFRPIDIIYKPIKKIDNNVECFFTEDIRLAYRALIHRGSLKFNSASAKQCYYCDTFVVGKPTFEKYLLNCGHVPGITYKFQNEHFSGKFSLNG